MTDPPSGSRPPTIPARTARTGCARTVASLALALGTPVLAACGRPDAAPERADAATAGNPPALATAPPVPDSAVIIVRTASPPRIDGEVDAVWEEAVARPIRVPVAGTSDGDADLEAEFRTLHDDRALYVLFSVSDDSSRSDSPLPFEDDAVEVYVDGGYERAIYFDHNDWQFVFGRDGRRWVTGGLTARHPGLESASAETATGYRVEISIPWDGLGVSPEDGAAIGLEAHVDDDDDGSGVDAVLAWHAAGPSYENASLLGAAVLGGAGGTHGGATAVVPAPPARARVANPLARSAEPRQPLAGADDQESLNALTGREEAAGFELLFDGQSLNRWRGFRSDSLPAGWRAIDGAIALEPTAGGGDLVSREQYSDFELTLEWKISEGGNSGIFYRVSEDHEYAWETGAEMQVLDDERHSDGRDPITSAGSTFGLYAPVAGAVRPAGEWNRVRILVDGDRVTYWLNDVQVVTYRLWSDDWEARVAGSKFATMPDFARARTGHIVLQDHGNPVWYRNIKIRRLPERSDASAAGLRVLVFHETTGHDHDTRSAGVQALEALAVEDAFEVSATDDSRVFTSAALSDYDVVVFLNTTGDVLTEDEQAAFEAYVRDGGGFVGVHSAADTEYDWAWYGGLLGAWFAGHANVQPARMYVTETAHPSTRHLPATWVWTDEWYDFRDGPGAGVTVLIELDESSVRGGAMGDPHPIAWYHEYGGGRAFYTGLGHRASAFSDPLYMSHLLGGIVWAAGGAGDD